MINTKEITNLVFEGGGIGAIANAGFLAKAVKKGILSLDNITRVAGVSSGAIAGLQVALNYSVAEIVDELKNTDFKKFTDGQHGLISNILHLLTDEGFYKDEFLYQYLGNLIKYKTGDENTTFHDLQTLKQQKHFKDFYVVTTKLFMLDKQPAALPFIFSHETTPHARIVDAMRATTALPIIFPPLRLQESSDGKFVLHADGCIYVDGGIIKAYPIRIFDNAHYIAETDKVSGPDTREFIYNTHTLGVRLESPMNIKLIKDKAIRSHQQNITSRLQYAEAILYVLRYGQQESLYDNDRDLERSVIINTLGITSTDFNLDDVQKAELIKSGEKAVDQLVNMTKL